LTLPSTQLPKDPTEADEEGATPLHWACSKGDPDIVAPLFSLSSPLRNECRKEEIRRRAKNKRDRKQKKKKKLFSGLCSLFSLSLPSV
jgi:ankyrin repeat protein